MLSLFTATNASDLNVLGTEGMETILFFGESEHTSSNSNMSEVAIGAVTTGVILTGVTGTAGGLTGSSINNRVCMVLNQSLVSIERRQLSILTEPPPTSQSTEV